MCWLRENIRVGGILALFALAIQLVVSFGHVHLDGGTSPGQVVVQGNPAAIGPPADSNHGRDAQDYCAICAVLSLVSGSVTPSVAVLATPASYFQDWIAIPTAAVVSFGIEFLFRARAPPRSI
jgi:hypothetical protein